MDNVERVIEGDCPRRASPRDPEIFTWDATPDSYGTDDTCSYCGSLDGDLFMARLEAGHLRLGPTDKSYKVYITNDGGAPLKQTYRTDDDRTGDRSKWVWTTRETSTGKFYFQHLSVEQRKRFIELLNAKKIKFKGSSGFYVLPFFLTRGEPASL